MKRMVAIALFLATVAYANPTEDEPKKDGFLAGVYHLVGSENNKTYYGVLIVSHEDGSDIINTVVVVGGSTSHGIGIIKGDSISLAWKMTLPAGSVGVTHYEISKDKKTLTGVWVAPGAETPRREKATFLRPVRDKEI